MNDVGWYYPYKEPEQKKALVAGLRDIRACGITQEGREEMQATRNRWFYNPDSIPEVFIKFRHLFFS